MASNPQLTAGQKYTLRWMGPYEFFSSHSNGDVTVLIGSGASKQQVRISPSGTIIKRTSASGATTEHFQPSLSEELTEAIHTTKKPEKPKKEKEVFYPVVSYVKTPCQERPECCVPREIKHVAWDADHTIWDLPGTAAGVTGKLKKVDDDTVVEIGQSYGGHSYGYSVLKYSKYNIEDYLSDEEKDLLVGLSADEKDFLLHEMANEHNALLSEVEKPKKPEKGQESVHTTIKLLPTFRQTLDELEKKGITSSIISLNTPGSVKRILKEFGLDSRFVEIRDSYENKGKVFSQITKKIGVCPCDSLFIDDGRGNVQDVTDKCGVGLQIGMGKDIEKPIEIMKFIKG